MPENAELVWCGRRFRFVFPRPALVMGVVNVTPDSFSDGGQFLDPQAAVAHARQLVAEGADLLDIGGESTRPGAALVTETEELRRVLPVIEALVGQVKVPLSIDTRKPAVARAALAAGAAIVNDIAAAQAPPAMWAVVAEAQAGYVAMHMQGTPETMQLAPHYEDVVAEVSAFFGDCRARLTAAGVASEQVVFDPGIGFGKSLGHNLDLLARLAEFKRLDRPLLVGVSRKSFVGKLLGAEVAARLPGSLAGTVWAAGQGVQIFRTHDVAAT
ncbi:MAG TPA: dihydropteroate synthase, partial [Candidatus Limnocylindria bacterium]|nr:dihydropteroate synthase [Candidatus Limnocylindria bacterium]